jgi:exodeoxyribonuclease V gamma subunit
MPDVRLKEIQLSQKHPLKVIYGNDLGRLALHLGEEFFSSSSHPFENRLVIVPDLSMKEFLLSSFAADPRLQIAAGVQFLPLNQALIELGNNKKRIPSFLELSLIIEERLRVNPRLDSSLQRYLDTGIRRFSSLSDQLAAIFIRYGLYGIQFLPKWLESPGWQQSLWREIYSDETPWTYPLHALISSSPAPFSGKMALFGFSYLSPVHLSFFSAFSASLYALSPCALFWEDMASDKERLFLAKVMKKRGTKQIVRAEMDQYLQQSHPLLGNWGKLEKEFLKTLDRFELIEEEVYEEPLQNHALRGNCNSLLSEIKKSLLFLDETTTFSLDDSIQLHSASSRMREVEVLRDCLETLMHAKGITPRDILVLSPDIAEYAPYIQMAFDQSRVPYCIEGIPLISLSQAVQGFLQLISLPEHQFSLTAVMKLLRCQPWMDKCGWTSEETGRLFHWFKDAEIREKLTSDPNSWQAGIDRLLFGLAVIPKEDDLFDAWPAGCVPLSEVDLLNQFLEQFDSLQKDLAMLDEEKSVPEWIEFFLRLAEKYLCFEWERESFFQQLKTISLSCRSLKEKVWNFESMRRVLSHLAHKPSGEIASHQLQRVSFASLRAGSLRPAIIIWCLGLHEGAFPRSDVRNSLFETITDYAPSKTDEDRALFLDLFLHAQDNLILSFQRLHPEDAKQQGPSLLIDELNQYLIKRGVKEGLVPVAHPANYSSRQEMKPFFGQLVLSTESFAEICIDIRQIKKLAKNPFQFYFNETLKIYLKEDEDEEEKEFLLSHLRKWMLRKKGLKTAASKGRLPSGLFSETALQELEEETKELLENLAAFEISPEEVRSVRLKTPLEVPLSEKRTAFITGTLEDIAPKGLLFHGANDLKSLVRAWPLYLISLCLNPGGTKLFFTKSGEAIDLPIADPKAELASYIDYFILAKHSPSPLMPDWAEALLMKTQEEFSKAVAKGEDPYLDYLNRRGGIDSKAMFSVWSGRLRQLFEGGLIGV